MGTELVTTVASITEAIKPFQPDDCHKGTFIILRVAGLEQRTALRLVNRKARSWQHWRATDEYFRELDDQIPALAQRFGGEARVIRTALMDISIIEAGIGVFRKILNQQPVTDGMWAYATKLAGLRVPMMGAKEESESPWERLANSIKNTLAQRELTVKEVGSDGKERSVTAREISVQPSAEQKQMASEIVGQILSRAGGS